MYRPQSSNRVGGAAVEFAVVVPVVLLMILGLIEWGRFEMIRQVTLTAAFNGARLGALPGTTDLDVEEKVDAVLEVYLVSGATTATTFTEEMVTVNVQVPVGPNAFFLKRFFGNAILEREYELKLE